MGEREIDGRLEPGSIKAPRPHACAPRLLHRHVAPCSLLGLGACCA